MTRYMLTDDKDTGPMLDVSGPSQAVQVQFNDNTLWVNVDGVCRLRVCWIPKIEIDDQRHSGIASLQENEE